MIKKIIISILLIFILTGCKVYPKLAEINGASGICIKNDLIYTVSDKGNLFKLNKVGYKIKDNNFGKLDLEGVVCTEDNIFVLIESGSIIRTDYDLGNIKSFDLEKKDKYFSKKSGAEGITYIDGIFYISTQAEKDNLLKYEFKNNKFSFIEANTIKYTDLSGLDYYDGNLYIISDKNDKIFKYDHIDNKIISETELSEKNWEGIAFDRNGDMYFADDKGYIRKK